MVPLGLVARIIRLPTDEPQAGRIGGNSKGQRIFFFASTKREGQGVHQYLVRCRSVRPQHRSATQYQSMFVLACASEMGVLISLLRGGFAPVDLWIDDGVGQEK